MQKKTTGVIAGIAGAALLMGGTTFALWSDSDTVDGAAITAGNLDVDVLTDKDSGSTWSWVDLSEDRTDAGHAINPDTFRIIPGDTIQGTIALDVALEGDNMVANLGFAPGAWDGDLTGLDIDLDVTDAAGTAIDLGAGDTIQLASADNTNNSALPTVGADLDGSEDLFVVVTVTFPEATGGTDYATTSISLEDSTITLDQVRSAADGYIG